MNRTVRNAAVVAAAIAIDLTFWSGEVQAFGGGVVPIWLPVLATVVVHTSLWWRRSRPVAVFAAPGRVLAGQSGGAAVAADRGPADAFTFAVAATTGARRARVRLGDRRAAGGARVGAVGVVRQQADRPDAGCVVLPGHRRGRLAARPAGACCAAVAGSCRPGTPSRSGRTSRPRSTSGWPWPASCTTGSRTPSPRCWCRPRPGEPPHAATPNCCTASNAPPVRRWKRFRPHCG